MISKETVEEWQQVLSEELSIELTEDEARQYLAEYVSFISLLSEINQRNNLKDGSCQ